MFVHSPLNGHLDYQFLAIVDDTVENIENVQMCGHPFLFLLGGFLEMELLGSMFLCLTFFFFPQDLYFESKKMCMSVSGGRGRKRESLKQTPHRM